MSNRQKVEQLLIGLFTVMLLVSIWTDSVLTKLILLAIAVSGCVSLLWLRRYLSKEGLVISTISFLGMVVFLLINLFFLA